MSIQYIRYKDNQILVRFNGLHRNIQDDKEVVDRVFNACINYKSNPSEENKEVLMGVLNPISTKEYSDNFHIDRQGRLFLKDTNVPLPEDLSELVKEFVNSDHPIEPLTNFWKLCLTNPNKEARDGFYHYVKTHGIVITDNGYAVLYKAVNVKGTNGTGQDVNASESRWVNSQYLRIKGMKKAPKNYPVWEIKDNRTGKTELILSTHSGDFPDLDERYDEDSATRLGSLQDLYEMYIEESKELDESTEKVTVFKPWHSGHHGMTIKVGIPVNMPREKCDPDINIGCSYGLHVGSYSYVSSFGSGMDSILAVLVNPKDVVALPKHDFSKIRVCEYMPYAEMTRDELGDWEELESKYFEEDFISYEIESLEKELEELLSSKEEDVEEDSAQEVAIKQRLIDLRS